MTVRVPRAQCNKCGIRLVSVPWARSGSGFTLLFEAMPVKTTADFVNIHDTGLWRVLHHYVDDARDHSAVRHVGVDETSSKRGHNYVSLFVDLEEPKVLFVNEGKCSSTVQSYPYTISNSYCTILCGYVIFHKQR